LVGVYRKNSEKAQIILDGLAKTTNLTTEPAEYRANALNTLLFSL